MATPILEKGFQVKKYTISEIEELASQQGWTESQLDRIKNIFVPSEWIAKNLWLPGTSNPKTVPFDVREGSELYRDYQYKFIHDNERFIDLRITRQGGKTSIMLAELAYLFFVYPGIKIILITPYKAQALNLMGMLWNEIIDDSYLSDMEFKKEPYYEIRSKSFGSSIKGFMARETNKSGTSPIRSHTAQVLCVDEADFLTPDEVAVAEGTLQSYGDLKMVRASSTLSDIEGSWFHRSVESGIFKDYWVPFNDSPMYSKTEEQRLLAVYPYDRYVKEFLVDWSKLSSGLFRPEDLNEACDKSNTVIGRPYNLKDPEVVPLFKEYVFGVDWNTAANGVQVVILGVDANSDLWIYDIVSVTEEEFTQTKAVISIIELIKEYDPKYIYVDQGYGDMQVEQLVLYSFENPQENLRLNERLRGINFREKIKVSDPYTGTESKKQYKSLSVTILQFLLEKRSIYLPEDQWTYRTGTKKAPNDIGIIDEMRSFYVKKYDSFGDPVFDSNRSDHKLSALLFGILAYAIEMYPEYFIHVDQNKMIERFGLVGNSGSASQFVSGIINNLKEPDNKFPPIDVRGDGSLIYTGENDVADELEDASEDDNNFSRYSTKRRIASRNIFGNLGSGVKHRRRLW